MNNIRHIILDTETTGLDPLEGHKLVEIGAIELIDFKRTGKTFHAYINPQREVPQAAFKVHGLSYDFLKDHKIFNQISLNFLEFIKDSILVIHNAAFDLKFLNYELKLQNFEIIRNEIVDTLLLARKKFPGSPANLDALCKKFNISLSSREKHGALIDSELLSLVFLELIGNDKQYTLSLNSSKEVSLIPQSKISFPRRSFPISEKEETLHRNLLTQIKNSIWNN